MFALVQCAAGPSTSMAHKHPHTLLAWLIGWVYTADTVCINRAIDRVWSLEGRRGHRRFQEWLIWCCPRRGKNPWLIFASRPPLY